MKIPIYGNGEKLETLNPKEFICESTYYKAGHTNTPEIKLRAGVVERLRKAQNKLKQIGKYKLKIFDGFRTVALQEKMYNKAYKIFEIENPDFNGKELKELTHKFWAFPDRNPLSPPPHNTGGAVDLTIVNEKNVEISMGTGFDDLTEKASTDYYSTKGQKEKNADIYNANRILLKQVMEEAGFKNYPEEWWHFDYGNQEWVKTGDGKKAIYGSAEK
jgi:D-alanyl-D-alanine dipeptidase